MAGWLDSATAQSLRDIMTATARTVINNERPAPRYAVVNSIDRPGRKCMVTFTGSTTSVPVSMGSVQPNITGQTVRIGGTPNDRYIEAVLGGHYIAPIVYDHGGLTGLADDDHPQYLLKAGGTMTGPLLLPDGSTSNPSLSNHDDPNTGVRWPAGDSMAFVVGGSDKVILDPAGQTLAGFLSMSGALKSDVAVPAQKYDGTSVAPLYATSFRKTTLGADHTLTNVGSGSEVTILTDTFATIRPNAVVTIMFNLEARITTADAARLGIFVCKVDGTAETDAMNIGYPTVILRDPRHRVFGPVTLATPGSHTILIGARKNGAGGTIIAGQTNTNMILRIDQ